MSLLPHQSQDTNILSPTDEQFNAAVPEKGKDGNRLKQKFHPYIQTSADYAKQLDHDLKTKELEIGSVGYFFGKGETQKNNIVSTLCFAVMIIGLIITIWSGDKNFEFWKIVVVPLVSVSLGYMFGKKE